MIRRPPRSTRTDTRFPYTTLFRSLDASAGSVALSLPGSDLAFELRAIVDATVQALASQDTDLDLGHVEPAGVLRREVELQPAEEAMGLRRGEGLVRSEEHTSELQSIMRISYAVFCLKNKKRHHRSPTVSYRY